jgi:hypothetical protein
MLLIPAINNEVTLIVHCLDYEHLPMLCLDVLVVALLDTVISTLHCHNSIKATSRAKY